MSHRTEESSKNMFMGFVNQMVNLVLGFILRTIFIHSIGIEYLGLNGLFSDVLQMLSMADLGFSTAMAYSFYKPIANNDTDKIARLVGFYKQIYIRIAVVISLLGIALIPFINLIVNVEQDIPFIETYYALALAGVVVSYLYAYKTTILIADQKRYVVTRIAILCNLVRTIVQIVVLFAIGSYVIYLVANLLSNIASNVIASRTASKHYPFLRTNNKLTEDEKRSIFINLKSVFIYKISAVLINATDNIIISTLISTAAVGLYSNYLMLSTKMASFIQIIFGSLTASIGNVVAKENSSRQYGIFKCTQTISFILCGFVTALYSLLVNDFILLWLGQNYQLKQSTVFFVSLNIYLSCLLQPLFMYREATGIYVKTKYVMLAAAFVNLTLSIGIGMVWGINGIISASAISRLTTYFWYEPKLLFKNYFHRPVKDYYVSIIKNAACIALIILILFLSFNYIFAVVTTLTWIIKAFVTILFTGTVLWGVYHKDEGYKMVQNKIKVLANKSDS